MEKNKSFYPVQTIYGSLTRYEWFRKFLTPEDKVVDIGCGTGVMITIPLIEENFDIIGLDLDACSIEYGRDLLKKTGLPSDRLICKDFGLVSINPHKIILSEVLEHLNDQQIDGLLTLLANKLQPGGLLLITVPNGYGWFEFESFLWYKLKLGKVVNFLKIENYYIGFKNKVLGFNTVLNLPSSLDHSPHIQRFTYRSLPKLLKKYGFKVKEYRGGSFVSGPFTNLLFTGFSSAMKLNMFLGRKLPFLASDFYIALEK